MTWDQKLSAFKSLYQHSHNFQLFFWLLINLKYTTQLQQLIAGPVQKNNVLHIFYQTEYLGHFRKKKNIFRKHVNGRYVTIGHLPADKAGHFQPQHDVDSQQSEETQVAERSVHPFLRIWKTQLVYMKIYCTIYFIG